MEWIILFVANWIIFLLLVNWKELKTNMWAGLLASSMAIIVDFCNISHGRYTINRPVICILDSSLFFVLGPVFIIGTLLAQYHPKRRLLSVLNVIVIFIIYSSTELILVYRGAVEYLEWHFYDSLIINIGAILIISWFSIVVLNKWGVER
ncbi:hypothetical protein R9X47_14720 [Wukongibacter baidiensis]|uniref:hypothetical protein n=1 Tax=Wukongibacter baidiensis TaxID=1723361 RepID=UPI003D7F4297